MGEFYQLSQAEADELNKGDGHEPIMGAKYMAHGCQPGDEPTDDHDCFETYRVWGRDPNTGRKHATLYTVYDAQALWQNLKVQTNIKNNPQGYFDPKTRNPFWREDWYELHNRYDAGGNVPDKVAKLPRMSPTTAPADEWPDTEPEDEWEEDWSSEEEEEEEEQEQDVEWDPMNDLDHLHHLANLVNNEVPPFRRDLYAGVGNQVTRIIDRSSRLGDYEQYHGELLDVIYRAEDSWISAWLMGVIARPDSIYPYAVYPYAVRGQVLRLLAFFAHTYTVRDIIREGDEPWTVSGRLDPSTAGRFTAAVRQYMHHLMALPTIAADPSMEHDYERDTRPQRLADARRVLHYMKWQHAVKDEWLEPPQRLIVDRESEIAWISGRVEVANQLVFDLDRAIVEGGLDAVGGPAQHEAVMAKIWTFWTTLKEWQSNRRMMNGRCPFGRQIVKLWGVANYAQRKASTEHTNPDFLSTGSSSEAELSAKTLRYKLMTERLVRTLWLSVSMWYRANPDAEAATDDEMMMFFYQYVAHFYTNNPTGWELFACDTDEVEDANDDMLEQLMRAVEARAAAARAAAARAAAAREESVGLPRSDTPRPSPASVPRYNLRERTGPSGETPDARRQRNQ